MRVPHRRLRSRRRLATVAAAIVVSTAAACSGGTGQGIDSGVGAGPTAPQTPFAASTALAIVQQPYGFVANAGAEPAIRLYAGPFNDDANAYRYAIAVEGASTTPYPVRWSVSSPTISLSPAPGDVVVPPPGGIEIGSAGFGKATLTATSRTQTASIPVYSFPAVFFGCTYRRARSADFDPSPQPSRAPLAADAYVTGPIDSNGDNPCVDGAYVTAAGTPYVFHFPYGATIATDGDDPAKPVVAGATRGPAFEAVDPAAYRDDFTAITSSALEAARSPCAYGPTCGVLAGSIVVFKTAGGRVVKMWISAIFATGGTTVGDGATSMYGVYETTTEPGGSFPY